MFRVGQKVVCVDDSWRTPGPGWGRTEAIVRGQVYTVHKCFIDEDGDAIVWLAEVRRDKRVRFFWGEGIGYLSARFRPVVERKTDISVFQKLLQPKPERVT